MYISIYNLLTRLVVILGLLDVSMARTAIFPSSTTPSPPPPTTTTTTTTETTNTTSAATRQNHSDADAVTAAEDQSRVETSAEFAERLERSKIARRFFLQRHILDTLGWVEPPAIDRALRQRLLENISSPTPVFVTRHKKCHYPACDIPMVNMPSYVNRSLWFDNHDTNRRFYFNVQPDRAEAGHTITSAVIKLHLRRREGCECTQDGEERTSSRLHIKLYKYIKPVRTAARLRPRNKRLLDAKMVTWEGARWVTLQATGTMENILNRRRRNGGFEVQVADMNENTLDANAIIDPTICTSLTEYDCTEAGDNPINEGMDVDEETDQNLSPILEISYTSETRIPVS